VLQVLRPGALATGPSSDLSTSLGVLLLTCTTLVILMPVRGLDLWLLRYSIAVGIVLESTSSAPILGYEGWLSIIETLGIPPTANLPGAQHELAFHFILDIYLDISHIHYFLLFTP
jgi:hypothetical protein